MAKNHSDYDEEARALLEQPSPHSNEGPSSDSALHYGSVRSSNKGSDREPLNQMSRNESRGTNQNSFPSETFGQKIRKRKKLLLSILLVAAAAALGLYFGITKAKESKAARGAAVASKSSNSVHKQRGFISTPEKPLSLLHPVNDLSVKPYDRHKDTRPNRDLFQLDKSTQQQLKSSYGTKGVAPPLALPTNAWYQNLLLLKGEPGENQRVYPVPYVVDAAGPIPGLRFHHPTVKATVKIIQLNQVLSHGLTIGATTRQHLLGTSQNSSLSTDDDDNSQAGKGQTKSSDHLDRDDDNRRKTAAPAGVKHHHASHTKHDYDDDSSSQARKSQTNSNHGSDYDDDNSKTDAPAGVKHHKTSPTKHDDKKPRRKAEPSSSTYSLARFIPDGLTKGFFNDFITGKKSKTNATNATEKLSHQYAITKMTPLGITLEWTDRRNDSYSEIPFTYSSTIVRGMPYGTIQYNSNRQFVSSNHSDGADDEQMLPTVVSEISIASPPVIDGNQTLDCGSQPVGEPYLVNDEIELLFLQSDYTWLVFVSRPVRVQCIIPKGEHSSEQDNKETPAFALQFLDDINPEDTADLVIRLALMNDCTNGRNPITCGPGSSSRNQTEYGTLLRRHKDLYPGPDSDTEFIFETDNDTNETTAAGIKFNWNVQSMTRGEIFDNTIDNKQEIVRSTGVDSNVNGRGNATANDDQAKLLMYALPHHQDMIDSAIHAPDNVNRDTSFPTNAEDERFCRDTLIGPACIVQGSTWNVREEFSSRRLANFRAPRHPKSGSLPTLATAFVDDLELELPEYFMRGAGDTYFSGKQLAKLGRILTIGEELSEICDENNSSRPEECQDLDIPTVSDDKFQSALSRLRAGVEIWINGTAVTPFVYDDKWGGLVSCGCDFDEKKGDCKNRYPECPAFSDPGMNFGNAYYNDHHFHYGYHIYAAAVLAYFDPKWGREHFEEVLLLIRDIANPSHDDTFFPMFRHKDWYQGSSWASGTSVTPANGRNQESSSEAIAAYEAIGLYGTAMADAWRKRDAKKLAVAEDIKRHGLLLTASELRAADRYWHVIEAAKRRQYPIQYEPHVIGIMWNTMAQFQTWFGNAAFLTYGIQMLPLTAVSEERDTIEWVREVYVAFSESCEQSSKTCEKEGWSILVNAMLATVGHPDEAVKNIMNLTSDVFESAGGNGHSLTNTLWYLATRKDLVDPLIINPTKGGIEHNATVELGNITRPEESYNTSSHVPGTPHITKSMDCGCPDTCNEKALNQFAFGHTCRDRIIWLITMEQLGETEACRTVGLEFPSHCGACDPQICSAEEAPHSKNCPPCTRDVCRGPLNQCMLPNAPFLCMEGISSGGCSRSPWSFGNGMCESCCELSLGCEN